MTAVNDCEAFISISKRYTLKSVPSFSILRTRAKPIVDPPPEAADLRLTCPNVVVSGRPVTVEAVSLTKLPITEDTEAPSNNAASRDLFTERFVVDSVSIS